MTILLKAAPGLLLCLGVGLSAILINQLGASYIASSWLAPLVLALLIGAGIRSILVNVTWFDQGIRYASKYFLEMAVTLLGASVSLSTLAAAGLSLVCGIVLTVAITIIVGAALGRALGLDRNLALLIGCGTAICGNSAIAAVAPVIGAKGKEVTASIAFTAATGIGAVVLIPTLATLLSLTEAQGGALAGMTVYAVPQAIAAAQPLGVLALKVATIVKLIRVMMLGPAIILLSFTVGDGRGQAKVSFGRSLRFLPWFIFGFVGLVVLNSSGALSPFCVEFIEKVGSILMLLAMAGLGLSTNIKDVVQLGPRAAICALLTLLVLTCGSLLVVMATPMEFGA